MKTKVTKVKTIVHTPTFHIELSQSEFAIVRDALFEYRESSSSNSADDEEVVKLTGEFFKLSEKYWSNP